MSNDFQKDELRVEQYDAAAAEAKRKKIFKRVGIGVGLAAALAILTGFGLVVLGPELFGSDWLGPNVRGGSGSWYASVVVPKEDSHG